MLGWGRRTISPINTNLLVMFISVDGLTADPELDCSSVCTNYLGTIYSFSTHLFTQLQRHSKVEVTCFLWKHCWRLQTSYCIKGWEDNGASDKSEKQKAGKVKQWEGKLMNEKGKEKKVSHATDLGENACSVWSGNKSTNVTPSLLFLWKSLEIHVGITRLHLWRSFSFW